MVPPLMQVVDDLITGTMNAGGEGLPHKVAHQKVRDMWNNTRLKLINLRRTP